MIFSFLSLFCFSMVTLAKKLFCLFFFVFLFSVNIYFYKYVCAKTEKALLLLYCFHFLSEFMAFVTLKWICRLKRHVNCCLCAQRGGKGKGQQLKKSIFH